jgi:hypothetical protein
VLVPTVGADAVDRVRSGHHSVAVCLTTDIGTYRLFSPLINYSPNARGSHVSASVGHEGTPTRRHERPLGTEAPVERPKPGTGRAIASARLCHKTRQQTAGDREGPHGAVAERHIARGRCRGNTTPRPTAHTPRRPPSGSIRRKPQREAGALNFMESVVQSLALPSLLRTVHRKNTTCFALLTERSQANRIGPVLNCGMVCLPRINSPSSCGS